MGTSGGIVFGRSTARGLVVLIIALSLSGPGSDELRAQPRPGDIFREFTFQTTSGRFSELDPDTPREWPPESSFHQRPTRIVRPLELDLAGATRAELSVEYWGGHIGTTEQKFRVNNGEWIYLPQPSNTPGDSQCYYRTVLGNNAVPIPLETLRNGVNDFVFTAGPQSCYNFNWGFYWVYSFTVRLYYEDTGIHSAGRLIAPQKGDTLREFPLLTADLTSGRNAVRSVDFIGYYNDFDWDGNGIFKEWQYATNEGKLIRHIGTATAPPYRIRWNSSWVPDQHESIKLAVRITDETGLSYISPAVEDVVFQRHDWAVKMYASDDVPERFGVRAGNTMKCTIDIPDDLSTARTARIVMSTWSARTNDGSEHDLLINGHRLASNFGVFHDRSFDEINVPLEWLKEGENEISIHSTFMGHALEINWPGPVLLISYVQDGAGTSH